MYFNFLLNYLKDLEVPDTEFEGGFIYENTAFVEQVPDNIDLVTDKTLNAITLSIKGLRVGFKSKNFYYRSGLLVAKGSVDATISEIAMDVTVAVNSQTLKDGRMVPSVSVPNFKLVIPKNKIDIKIHGNTIVAIADAFKKFFIYTMTGKITKVIEKQVKA